MLGLWLHKWRPSTFCLIVEDFGVDYVGACHALHLRDALEEHYKVIENWKGYLLSRINID